MVVEGFRVFVIEIELSFFVRSEVVVLEVRRIVDRFSFYIRG